MAVNDERTELAETIISVLGNLQLIDVLAALALLGKTPGDESEEGGEGKAN